MNKFTAIFIIAALGLTINARLVIQSGDKMTNQFTKAVNMRNTFTEVSNGQKLLRESKKLTTIQHLQMLELKSANPGCFENNGQSGWSEGCNATQPCFRDYTCDMSMDSPVCVSAFCSEADSVEVDTTVNTTLETTPHSPVITNCGEGNECVYGNCVPVMELVNNLCYSDDDCLPAGRFTCNNATQQCEADYCVTGDGRCTDDEFCLNGFQCMKLRKQGDKCTAEDQCRDSLVCDECHQRCLMTECTRDFDCPEQGDVCQEGECTYDQWSDMGAWCEDDQDCGNDELVCTDNMCMGNECTVEVVSGVSTSTGCPGQNNCSNGFCDQWGNGQFAGRQCGNDDWCRDGLTCVEDNYWGESEKICHSNMCQTDANCEQWGEEYQYCFFGECW